MSIEMWWVYIEEQKGYELYIYNWTFPKNWITLNDVMAKWLKVVHPSFSFCEELGDATKEMCYYRIY